MLERMLSPTGRMIYITILVISIGIAFVLLFAGWGKPIDDWQAKAMGGSYYPALTFVLFCLPGIGIGFVLALAFDFVTGQGRFARNQWNDSNQWNDPNQPPYQ